MPAFADDPHVERIAEALWIRKPVGSAALLVGAGFSRNGVPDRPTAGSMPGWNDIYKTMVEQLYPAEPQPAPADAQPSHRKWFLQQTGATSAYLRVAEEFEAQFGRDTLDKLILRHVPDRQFSPGKLHKMLVELPWADILTTNWDTLLERAGEAAEERVYDVLRTVDEIPEARAPRIIKLHGSFPSSRPFIFTEEDFRRYPERSAAFVNLAQQVAMENTLVLLGFSGDDPNFLFWSGWVRDRLGPKAPLIYLVGVLGLSASKRKMLESRRIQPIDLGTLPDYARWPSPLRMANAHQWFLERLRVVEPYPAQRWPKPPAGFFPPLELVSPRFDPRAPLPDPPFDGQRGVLETTRLLVAQWRQNRMVYPGWIVAPFETGEFVWTRIRIHLGEIVGGLRAMEHQERLEALFELNWQLDVALIPLVLTVDDLIIELLDAMVEQYDALSDEQGAWFRALVLAIIRHAREEGDRSLFDRWSAWLDPRIQADGEAQDRLAYERILRARIDLEVDAVEAQLNAWTIKGDSFWMLRKAGLLAELGRDAEAEELSGQALTRIRAQAWRGKTDIAAWSRESFAMLLRASVLQGEIGRWVENQSARDRFDLRQDQLLARGCPGKRDFFDLTERLAQVPPPIRSRREVSRKFDLGSTYITHRLDSVDPRRDRLLAYQALRYQEETGLPIRIADVGVAAQILIDSARWLMDVAPARATDAILRASPSLSNKQFETLLTRVTVARMDSDEAERLLGRLDVLVAATCARIGADATPGSFWRDRLKSTLEIASRILLRSSQSAPRWLEIALALQADPRFRRRFDLGDELTHLLKRAFETARAADRDAMLLSLFSSAIPLGVGPFASDAIDLAAILPLDVRPSQRGPEWGPIVDATIAALRDRPRRKVASIRLNWLLTSKLLDETEHVRAGEALWHPDLREEGLPGETVFFASTFLSLPRPDDVDPRSAVVDKVLNGAPLTDAIVGDGELVHALEDTAFHLDENQLVAEIVRLRDFVASHPDASVRPSLFGTNRENVVENTSRMAAALARRAASAPTVLSDLSDLFTLERHPLRPEPAMPTLVNLELLDPSTARIWLRNLLLEGKADDGEVLQAFLDIVRFGDPVADEAFEASIWSECAQAVAARRPEMLFRLLRFFALMFCRAPDRVPKSVDDPLSIGLGIILDDTTMTAPADHLQYDPSLARHFGAFLATAMHHRGRGDPAVRAAWIGAIESDPLPDTRDARMVAERIIADVDRGDLDDC